MTISGAIKPKAYYPRFKWGSPTVTTDIVEPAVIAMTRNETGLRGQNIVASGKAEYLFGRIEEAAQLQLMCEQDQLAALRWFTRDWAGQGKQFQAWIDRFTGSCWLFENNLKDQNGLALTLNGGYAHIDRHNPTLNADREMRGQRAFVEARYAVTPELTLSTFFTRAFHNDFPIPNRTRFDFVVSYNVLKALQRNGLW